MRACTPFVTEPIGTSSTGRSGQRPCHICARDLAVQRGDAVRVDDVRSANGVSPKPLSSAVDAAERDELVPA